MAKTSTPVEQLFSEIGFAGVATRLFIVQIFAFSATPTIYCTKDLKIKQENFTGRTFHIY